MMRDDKRVKCSLIQIIACVVGCFVALDTPAAMAQAQGTLVGVVRDATGAVLPGVVVTVTGAALGTPRTLVTNEQGRYELDNLPTGRYVVEAALSGFGSQIVEIAIDGIAATQDLVLAVSSFSESVTVTATKAGVADIHSTPMAITVLPARTIEQLGIHTVDGLAGFVPTLTVSQSPGGRVLVTIRGIGTNTGVAGADPSSTIYLDNVYLARPAMASMDLLDIERVEVLRGPQGTTGATRLVVRSTSLPDSRPTRSRRAFGSPQAITTGFAPKARFVARSSRTD
jgi:iron complex outermembrane receptor protein